MPASVPNPASQAKLRVLLLLPSLHGGGAERVAMHIMKHVDRSRFDVRMGLLTKTGPYVAELDESLVDVAVGERFLDFDQGNAQIYQFARLATGTLLAPANVVAMLRRFRPHVVLSFRKGMSLITLAAVTLYGRSRVRWLAREGNNTLAVIDDEVRSPLARRSVRQLTALCYRAADRLLTICHEMAHDLQTQLQLDPARVRTIYNAVDLAEVERRASEPAALSVEGPYLIGVGRLERQKGFDVLLHAFAGSRLRQTHRLVVIGEGSQEAALRELASELGIADRLLLPGWQDNPWALLRAADLFVLPSRWEGFGNVVIEAMASGAAVVVSDCSYGPKEIVRDGRDGLVVKTDDPVSTRAAIERLLDDAALRERFVAAGRARAREFDVPQIVGQYEALFVEAAAELGSSLG
jgi:glycosyltransferase involved in cell wall biosynthesis